MTIKILPVVAEIFKKRGGTLPKPISNQKFNDYIKEVCKSAGITNEREVLETFGGDVKRTIYKKYELVTAHTARRSYATNSYIMGIPVLTIMKITGHKTPDAFMKYIVLDKDEHASITGNAWEQTLKNQNALNHLQLVNHG